MKQPTLAMSSVHQQCCFTYSAGTFYKEGSGLGDCILFSTTENTTEKTEMFYSLIIKYKRLSSSLNIDPIKILQRIKLVKNIILRNSCYVTFSQKVTIKRDI